MSRWCAGSSRPTARKIIVTSRNRAWERVATPLPVDVFERGESVELLQKRSPGLSADAADRLAEALGDLPLAVEQAGTWHAVTGMPVDEYLDLLDQRSPEILDLDPAPDYPRLRRRRLGHITGAAQGEQPGRRQLLDICASMAPEPIPRSMLRGSRGVNITPEIDPLLRESIKLNRAVRDLSQFSLVKVDPRSDSLQMHRLLQTVLLAKLSPGEREQMRDAAHQLLSAAKPGPYGSSFEWRAYQALLPHVLTSQAVTSTDTYVRELVFDTLWFLYYWGDHLGAADFARQAWTAWLGVSGEEDIHVIRMTKSLGFLLRQIGQVPESIPLSEQALEVSRRIDVDPEEMVDSLCELADARGYQVGSRRPGTSRRRPPSWPGHCSEPTTRHSARHPQLGRRPAAVRELHGGPATGSGDRPAARSAVRTGELLHTQQPQRRHPRHAGVRGLHGCP